jgi:hypothetical protein
MPPNQTQNMNQAPQAASPQNQPVAPTPAGDKDPGMAMGTIALILAFLFAPLGIILGFVAYRKSKKAGKTNALGIAAMIIGAIVTLIAAAIFLMTVVFVNSAQKAVKQSQTTTEQSTPSAQMEMPAGYVMLDRQCFSVAVPSDNDAGTENDCILIVHYGKDKVAGFTISPFTKPTASMSDNVATWKSMNQSDTIVSEENVKFGGLDAVKIVHKPAGAYTSPQVEYFVGTGDKYKVGGYTVSGFQLTGRYDDQYDSKSTLDTVISTWQWK